MKRLSILLLISAIVLLSCDNSVHQKTFRVTFDNLFGTVTYATVKEGEAVPRPSDPIGDNTVGNFKAWVKDKNKPDETVYNFSTIVTDDITLYAHYYGLKTVTLQKPDGNKWKDVSVSYGSALSIEEDEIDGAIIETWLLNDKEYDITKPVTTDLTLKAKCYKKIEKDSEQYRQVLGLMKLSQLFLQSDGLYKGSDVTNGFQNSTLAQMLLSYTKNIDTETANTLTNYYNFDNTKYNLYLSYMNYQDFENLLYFKVNTNQSTTYANNYRYVTINDTTTVAFLGFRIGLHLDKGVYNKETGVVDEADALSSYTNLDMTPLQDGYIVSDANKNIKMEFVDSTKRFFERHNKITENETIATLIMKNVGDSDLTPEEYATKVSFCTVTFDEGNGTTYTKEILKGNKVYEPKTVPTASSGKSLFKYWSLDGKQYDFTSAVNRNITLKAEYLNESEYEKVIEAECIYKIATILSGFDKLAAGEQQPTNIYEEFESKQAELGQVLLCAKMSMNKDGKLNFTYNGRNYIFPAESGSKIDAYLDTEQGHSNVKSNKSSKSGDSVNLDLNLLTLHMKYYIEDTREYYKDSITFSIKATVTDNQTKATLSIKDGTTYPEVTVTKNENKIKYEIEDITYTKNIK